MRRRAFRSGADGEGPWFSIGAARYRPMNLVTPAALVGHWSGAGSQYTFRADGTYDTGSVSDVGGATLAAGSRGTWQLDGYLIALRPTGAPGWISLVATSAGALVLNNRLYTKR